MPSSAKGAPGYGIGGRLDVQLETENLTLDRSHFKGDVLVLMNVAAGNSIIVPAGLDVGEPVTVMQQGDGQTSFVADPGVTINTPETLSLNKKFASATLIPVGTDEYNLIGYLEEIA